MQKKTPKILVVEDEKSLLKAWQAKFEQEGLNVLAANSGKAGLEIALKNHPDLVVLDLVMPSSEGLTLIKKLREDKWGNRVPVVFLNSWRDPKALGSGVGSGRAEYMPSNWSPQEVIRKVWQKLEVMKLSVA